MQHAYKLLSHSKLIENNSACLKVLCYNIFVHVYFSVRQLNDAYNVKLHQGLSHTTDIVPRQILLLTNLKGD